MLNIGSRTRVFAYAHPCDMRKSFCTLSGLVSAMGHDVCAGDAFVFVAKNRKRAKILLHDGSGLCLLAKRLDVGLFPSLWGRPDVAHLELSATELALLIEGCDIVGKVSLKPLRVDLEEASRLSVLSFA